LPEDQSANSESIWIHIPFCGHRSVWKGYTMGNKAKYLSEEQETAIANRIGAQLKQNEARTNRPGRTSAYLVGAVSGIVLALAAPLLRPAMRSAVKGGILVGRYAKQVGSSMKEQFEDIVAEAEADLYTESGEGKEEV
jgi:Protein of unknown function (DUF5132)